jgi:2-haloacid dehalogenase
VSAILFDAMGTLFDLEPLRERLGAPALEAWFERVQHSAATLTLTYAFRPFDDVAAAAFRTTAARLELSLEPGEALKLLSRLPPAPDAAAAIGAARAAGAEVAILTNGTEQNTRTLIELAALPIEQVFATEHVEAYKPAPAPYEYAAERLGLEPRQLTLVAAHGWDVLGALNAGLEAVWVDRDEREWPFPLPEPRRAATLPRAVALALGRQA